MGMSKEYAARLLDERMADAAGGDIDALFDLGVVYASGSEVEMDFVQAHKWFNLAAARYEAEATVAKLRTEAKVPGCSAANNTMASPKVTTSSPPPRLVTSMPLNGATLPCLLLMLGHCETSKMSRGCFTTPSLTRKPAARAARAARV